MRLAIIGLGYIFRAVYAPILTRANVEVIALCDPNPEALAQAHISFSSAETYASVDKLLTHQSKQLDAVMVLTSERFNAPVAIAALKAGLPVFLEKPPAATSEQLDPLIRAEQGTGLAVYAAFNRRFTPLFAGWKPPAGLRRVQGALLRTGRRVDTFPYTAIHLLDAAPWLAGSAWAAWETRFHDDSWRVEGTLKNGVACELEIRPDGVERVERLVFTGATETHTLHFPNPDATRHPLGRILVESADGRVLERLGSTSDRLVSMGFSAAFDDFRRRFEQGRLADAVHRPESARTSIRLMEDMLAAISAPPCHD